MALLKGVASCLRIGTVSGGFSRKTMGRKSRIYSCIWTWSGCNPMKKTLHDPSKKGNTMAEIPGTNGDDTLIGTAFDDILTSFGGTDYATALTSMSCTRGRVHQASPSPICAPTRPLTGSLAGVAYMLLHRWDIRIGRPLNGSETTC